MNKLILEETTLVAVSSVKIKETIRALKKSMQGITYKEVIFISHEKPEGLPKDITFKECSKMTDINMYSEFIAYKLVDYVSTNFVLIVQHDGYVLHPNKWNNNFLKYDYIGAPWPPKTHFTNDGTEIRVGNGGFSLRSKRFLNILNELNLPFTDNKTGFYNEDGLLCLYYRKNLEEAGISFAPVEVASLFSRERWCHDSKLFTFGFHSNRRNIIKYLYRKLLKKLNKNVSN
jgi:hypothetical protein